MSSLELFMEGMIDYAGLFPPAGLPLETAITNFFQYRQQKEAWMLGRFIIPVGRLTELAAYAHLFKARLPTSLAVIGRGGKDSDLFWENLEEDLATINEFQDRYAPAGCVDVLEVRLPRSLFPSVNNVRLFVAEMADMLAPAGLTPFYEAPFAVNETGWFEGIFSICAGCGLFNRQADRDVAPAGIKIRCGGVTATAFPTPAQLAYAIAAAHDNAIPLKCTAGLHHPLRHYDQIVQTKMHGFFNLFGAALLNHIHNLPMNTLQAILEDEDPTHFTFNSDGFSWNDYRANPTDIAKVRQEYLISYGSCSFNEPCYDLLTLGYLL